MRTGQKLHGKIRKPITKLVAKMRELILAVMLTILLVPAWVAAEHLPPSATSEDDETLDAFAVAPRAGDLDISFGGDGKAVTDFGGRDDTAWAVLIQPDGKILVAGSSGFPGSDVVLARYRPNGALDTTFNGDGRVRSNFGGLEFASDIALQPDGKILVVGTILTTQGTRLLLARYLTNGSLESTFSGNGWLTLGPASDYVSGNAVVIQSDSKILVGGQLGCDPLLARYRSNGSLDPTFGSGGIVSTPINEDCASIAALALQPNGKIVAAGAIEEEYAIFRYLPDGTPDATFNGTGWVKAGGRGADASANAMALQPDGKIVIVGTGIFEDTTVSDLMRFLPNGTLDSDFGDNGRVHIDFGAALDLALQPDGKIVVVGFAPGDFDTISDLALARYLPNGSIDPTFGSNGIVLTDFGDQGAGVGRAVAIQPRDGRVVVAGTTAALAGIVERVFAIARYHAITCNGVVVTRIGTAGNDNIVGTSGNDVIYGFGGNDFVDGRGGNDIICGGTGDDTLVGRSGDDILRGGPGRDVCEGNSHIIGDRAVDCEVVRSVP